MAEGYGVKTSEKEGTGILLLVGGVLAMFYLFGNKLVESATDWGSNIGRAFDFGDPSNWFNQGSRTTGDALSNIGGAIDIGDPANPVNQFFASAGDWLSNVGSAIDLTEPGRWDWLSGSHGALATTGDFLGDVGHGIDLTDQNNPIRQAWDWVTPW